MRNKNNYNKWIYDNIKSCIGKNVLEIGAGLGSMTEYLVRKSKVVSTDISKKHITFLKNRFAKNRGYDAKLVDISKSTSGLNARYFDTVVCINVLEHIKEDIKCLKNAYGLLPARGKIVLVLPAFPYAFGTIDVSDNHYRRYNKKILIQLKKIGFRIVKARYMNFPGLIGWIWHGKILKLKVHKEGDLDLFNKLVPLFFFFEKIFFFLPGLSLIVVGEKK
jgi:SAM-dependent methyltransferase